MSSHVAFNGDRCWFALAGNFLAGLQWKRQNVSGMSGNQSERFPGACLRMPSSYPPFAKREERRQMW
jgi:hypothetical protein